MFRLAHLSDVHLGPLPDISYRELMSKRITGYFNWQRNRRKYLHDGIIDHLLSDIRAHTPHHIAITGDLVNLALDMEIELARQWLAEVGAGDFVSVVAGNHDAYVPGAFDKICKAWAPYMTGDKPTGTLRRDSFPYLRVRDNVAIIGVTSANATAPFMASGNFKSGQAERLSKILDETKAQGLCRVILIHHPPVREAVPQHKRLFGIARFQKVMRKHGAELILHGHSHEPSLYHIDGLDGKIPVIGVAAAGQSANSNRPASQFNLVTIDGKRGEWTIELLRRGLAGTALQSVDLSKQTFELA
ncbi:metallophosphoesterase family protein [Limoniibacter endophyticus]|uniref:Metallophosphatase n=1 Tax=Limoniibacter endophyticus TaxID=1565040 RepID=A0A8J3DLV0_9HYPH|nr:metallophosphoesterase [Limoniibacter endophyticus]GHC65482.1 metallophosphatase [Limoniibacter endophyticus]